MIDDEGAVRFDDGYEVAYRTDQDAVFMLSDDELRAMGVNYDEEKNQFTSRKEGMKPDDIALALAENRMQLAYEESSGALALAAKRRRRRRNLDRRKIERL